MVKAQGWKPYGSKFLFSLLDRPNHKALTGLEHFSHPLKQLIYWGYSWCQTHNPLVLSAFPVWEL